MNVFEHIKVRNPGAHKSWRGWGNPITARLLCPIEYIAQFKANPDEYVETPLQLRTLTENSLAPGQS